MTTIFLLPSPSPSMPFNTFFTLPPGGLVLSPFSFLFLIKFSFYLFNLQLFIDTFFTHSIFSFVYFLS